MRKFYERYSIGVFSNNVVNYISNDKFFKQQAVKKRTPNSTKSYGVRQYMWR